MLVVLHVCSKDEDAALRNLDWCKSMDGNARFSCVVSHDSEFDAAKVIKSAKTFFVDVQECKYDACRQSQWPLPQNHAFIRTAGYIYHNTRQRWQPWLWWEQDAVPLKPGWLNSLEAEYDSRKPFLGAVSDLGGRHLSGVAIYPADLAGKYPQITMCGGVPFDTAGGSSVFSQSKITPLIQHVWSFDGSAMDAPAPTFSGKADLDRIKPEAVLFHRCKDSSLVSLLKAAGSFSQAVQTSKVGLMQVLMKWKWKWVIPEFKKKRVQVTISMNEPKLIHCVERHKQMDKDSERRVLQAQDSWVTLYKTGQVLPAHVWEYERSSEQLGDSRRLPYLKDVLLAGLNGGSRNDFIFWTNDDSILHPRIGEHLLKLLCDKPAVSSFRINFHKGSIPDLDQPAHQLLALSRALDPPGDIDLGRDLFAFRKDWLREHWHEIPDFFLGELEFDLVMAYLIRKTYGVVTTKANMDKVISDCEIPKGWVLHEKHNRLWTSRNHEASSAKAWNRKLATDFYLENDMNSLIKM